MRTTSEPITTIAAVLREPNGKLQLEKCELAAPRAEELRIRMEACGICHTDLSARSQKLPLPLPAVLGHEGVGIVEAIGDGLNGYNIGDRVIASFGACGHCSNCNNKESAYCESGGIFIYKGRRLDGSSPISQNQQPLTGHFFAQSSFSQHAIVASTNAVVVSKELPAELLAPLACGALTGAGAVSLALKARPLKAFAAIGCGTVGLTAIMEAARLGCTPIVAVDVQESRLELAKSLGATVAINSKQQDLKTALAKTGGLDYALDSTGIPDVVTMVWNSLKKQGSLCCVGFANHDATISVSLNTLMGMGRRLIGSVEGNADPRTFIPQLIKNYQAGDFPLEKIVSTFDFADINSAIAAIESGEAIKPVVVFSQQAQASSL